MPPVLNCPVSVSSSPFQASRSVPIRQQGLLCWSSGRESSIDESATKSLRGDLQVQDGAHRPVNIRNRDVRMFGLFSQCSSVCSCVGLAWTATTGFSVHISWNPPSRSPSFDSATVAMHDSRNVLCLMANGERIFQHAFLAFVHLPDALRARLWLSAVRSALAFLGLSRASTAGDLVGLS